MTDDEYSIDWQEFEKGETWREFYTRVSNTMEKICNSAEKDLVIVTHRCAVGYIIAWWMKFFRILFMENRIHM